MTKDILFFDPKTKTARKDMDKQAEFEKHIQKFLSSKRDKGWGGRRTAGKGKKLGRPKNPEPTVRIRVFQSEVEHLQDYLQHLRKGGQSFEQMAHRLGKNEKNHYRLSIRTKRYKPRW